MIVVMKLTKKPTDEDYYNMENEEPVTLTGIVSVTAYDDSYVQEAIKKAEKYDNIIAENPELLELTC